MARTSVDELSETITPQLVTYLSKGRFNPEQLAQSFDYTGLEIDNFDRLKKLHFVLHEDVVEYIEKLPSRLRRIRTEQQQVQELTRGEVRGRVDWDRTITRRASMGYDDRTTFVIRNPAIELDIPENRVVKKLLAAIVEPLTEDIESINQDWASDWDDNDIIYLQQTLAQNVHLNELPPVDEISVSDRDLNTARRARQELYIEGARLYRIYDDLLNDQFERDPVQDFLRKTLLRPIRDYRVFELFCIFAIIARVKNHYPVKLRSIEPGEEAVAVLEGDNEKISIYYDEGGPLQFFEDYPTPEQLDERDVPEQMKRQAQALAEHDRFADQFLGRDTRHSFYRGRPDFLVLRRSKASDLQLRDVIIGEIKYTNRESTFSEGLRELLEYTYFAKFEKKFVFDELLPPDNVYGVICTDNVETAVDQTESVSHWPTTRLREFLHGN